MENIGEKCNKKLSLQQLREESVKMRLMVQRMRDERKSRNEKVVIDQQIHNKQTARSVSEINIEATQTESLSCVNADQTSSLVFTRLPSISIEPIPLSRANKNKETQCENTGVQVIDDYDDYISDDSIRIDEKQNVKTSVPTNDNARDDVAPKHVYSDCERTRILMDNKFRDFFDYSTKITQKVLYRMNNRRETAHQSESKQTDCETEHQLRLNQCFYSGSLCRDRVVTSFDWSRTYNELLLTTYNESAANEYDGLCLVWNLNYFNDTPEYLFRFHSPILSSAYTDFNSHLVVGGSYSGQIVLWDPRTHRCAPVQTSALSPNSHTHPVYCLKTLEASNSCHHCISVSTDGKMCLWSLDMLAKPIECKQLERQTVSKSLSLSISQPILASSMCFPSVDANHMIVGCENGSLYSIDKESAAVNRQFEGHKEFVTGVDCHPNGDYSNMYLTSSLDWTVKLWNSSVEKPMHTFECPNSVYDAKWSPINANSFASVDDSGVIDLWHVSRDIYSPLCSTRVDSHSALNRLTWTATGNQIVAGDSDGKVWIYDVLPAMNNELLMCSDIFKETIIDL